MHTQVHLSDQTTPRTWAGKEGPDTHPCPWGLTAVVRAPPWATPPSLFHFPLTLWGHLSLSPPLCLYASLSIVASVPLSLSLYLFQALCQSLSVFLSVSLSLALSVSLHLSLISSSSYLSLFLPASH